VGTKIGKKRMMQTGRAEFLGMGIFRMRGICTFARFQIKWKNFYNLDKLNHEQVTDYRRHAAMGCGAQERLDAARLFGWHQSR
jgi:hypothetical protein